MIDYAFNIGTVRIHVSVLIALIAFGYWMKFAIGSLRSREKKVKNGMRNAEKQLLNATAVLTVGWVLAFGNALFSSHSSSANEAGMVSGAAAITSQIKIGMSAEELKRKVGQPDEVRDDAETRGPGAQTWLYKGSRCAVHMIDGKVEAVE